MSLIYIHVTYTLSIVLQLITAVNVLYASKIVSQDGEFYIVIKEKLKKEIHYSK